LASVKFRQLVDWRAAIIAGLISGLVFLLANIILGSIVLGSPWIYVHVFASLLMGSSILESSSSFQAGVFIVALVVNTVLSVGFASLIAITFHRWGLVVGILGGATFGLALYFINFFGLPFIFPWFFLYRSWLLLVSHILFGAVAGGIYEALEEEVYAPVELSP